MRSKNVTLTEQNVKDSHFAQSNTNLFRIPRYSCIIISSNLFLQTFDGPFLWKYGNFCSASTLIDFSHDANTPPIQYVVP